MKRRRRKPDVFKAPIAPILRPSSDDWRERHENRKKFALRNEKILRQFCDFAGIELNIYNDNHHWKMVYNSNIVEWWPSSAKLIFNKRWREGIHTHDVYQVIEILKRKLLTANPNHLVCVKLPDDNWIVRLCIRDGTDAQRIVETIRSEGIKAHVIGPTTPFLLGLNYADNGH